MTIGDNIKLYRLTKGWSMQRLADECGSSKSYIWEIEKKRSIPTIHKVKKIAAALEVSILLLIDEVDMFWEERFAVWNKFSALNKEQKAFVIEMMGFVKEKL